MAKLLVAKNNKIQELGVQYLVGFLG